MFERFTDRARRAIALATQEAVDRGDPYVGSGHIVIGVVEEGTSVAAKALESAGVTVEALRTRLPAAPSPPQAMADSPPFSDEVKRSMLAALEASLRRGGRAVDAGDLLTGVAHGQGQGAQLLIALGVRLDQLAATAERLRFRADEAVTNRPRHGAIRLKCRFCDGSKLFAYGDGHSVTHPDTGETIELPGEIEWRCDDCSTLHRYNVVRPPRIA